MKVADCVAIDHPRVGDRGGNLTYMEAMRT